MSRDRDARLAELLDTVAVAAGGQASRTPPAALRDIARQRVARARVAIATVAGALVLCAGGTVALVVDASSTSPVPVQSRASSAAPAVVSVQQRTPLPPAVLVESLNARRQVKTAVFPPDSPRRRDKI